MKKLHFIALFVFFAFVFAGPVSAREEGIAAVVNQDVISMTDLTDRMRLILISSGLRDSPEVREKVAKQVMDGLIEEQLMMQEVEKRNIEISESEIEQGFAALAAQNKIPAEEFKKAVVGSGVNLNTMRRQIRAQMGWSKVIQKVLRPKITVTDGDINEYMNRVNASKGKPEYLLAEILLPVNTTAEENDVRQLAMRLVSEIREKRVPFSKIAQQFSKGPGAQTTGGDLGWLAQDQLQPELQPHVAALQLREVTDPIRATDGYHILLLREKREVTAESMPDREAAVSAIGLQRLDRMQRSYLMDLRSAAFIENRIAS